MSNSKGKLKLKGYVTHWFGASGMTRKVHSMPPLVEKSIPWLFFFLRKKIDFIVEKLIKGVD